MKKQISSSVFLLLLGAATLLGLGGLYWIGEKNNSQAETDFDTPLPPRASATGAFASGGKPQVSGPARDVFENALPDFVIALDRWGRNPEQQSGSISDDLRDARAAVVGAFRKAELSSELLADFETLIDSCMKTAEVPDKELDDAADAMMKATLTLNDAIATAGLGFFVDADILSHRSGTRSVLLFSFEIERVVLYRSGGHDVRTLLVRRLDNLNWTYSLLGFTSPKRRDAVVIANKLDEHLMDLLPALSKEIRMDPFHLSVKDSETAWFNPLRRLATEIIREELGGAGDEDLQRLGDLLARRVEIYQEWNELLEARRMSIDPPSQLKIEWKYRREMEGLVTHKAMDELDEIQNALAKPAIRLAYQNVHDHFAQSVERHEAQHRLDYAKLYTLPMPDALAEYVGDLPDGLAGQGTLAASALAEMSAYLSELARDPLTPKLNLTLLVRYLLDKGAWGMGESYAALVIVEGLADELGIEHEDFVIRRSINRDTIAEVYKQLCEVESDRFQDAAILLWARSFETELPVLELIAR